MSAHPSSSKSAQPVAATRSSVNSKIPAPRQSRGEFIITRSSTCKLIAHRSQHQMDNRYPRKCDSLSDLLPQRFSGTYDYATYTLEPQFLLPEFDPLFAHRQYKSTVKDYRALGGNDQKVAGMKIFTSILLNAWRRRREEVKHLTEKVEYLKRVSLQARNQIEFYNNLFRDEQKRNGELACHLKHSVESISHAKTSCDSLATSVISLRADKALMEQELRLKYRDYEELHSIFAKTKTDFCHSLVHQRLLEANINKERRNVKYLDEQKNKLINEICELRNENAQMEEKFHQELERRDQDLCRANEKIKFLESGLDELKEKAYQVEKYQENDASLHSEIELLQRQVVDLETSISRSMDSRLRSCWNNLLSCQKWTLQVAHLLAYYLLPATPPPTFEILSNRAIGYL